MTDWLVFSIMALPLLEKTPCRKFHAVMRFKNQTSDQLIQKGYCNESWSESLQFFGQCPKPEWVNSHCFYAP